MDIKKSPLKFTEQLTELLYGINHNHVLATAKMEIIFEKAKNFGLFFEGTKKVFQTYHFVILNAEKNLVYISLGLQIIRQAQNDRAKS